MEVQARNVAVLLCSILLLMSAASADTWTEDNDKFGYKVSVTAQDAYEAVKLGVGAIVGIVIAVLVAIVILIVACCYCCCRAGNRGPTTVVVQQPMQPMSGAPQVNVFQPAAQYPGAQQQVAPNPSSVQPPAYEAAKY